MELAGGNGLSDELFHASQRHPDFGCHVRSTERSRLHLHDNVVVVLYCRAMSEGVPTNRVSGMGLTPWDGAVLHGDLKGAVKHDRLHGLDFRHLRKQERQIVARRGLCRRQLHLPVRPWFVRCGAVYRGRCNDAALCVHQARAADSKAYLWSRTNVGLLLWAHSSHTQPGVVRRGRPSVGCDFGELRLRGRKAAPLSGSGGASGLIRPGTENRRSQT